MKHLFITIVWIIFAGCFLVLGSRHFEAAEQKTPMMSVTKRADYGSVKIMGMDIDKPLHDFAYEFNKQNEKQNEINRQANLASAWGYILAALTAVLSMVLEGKNAYMVYKARGGTFITRN